MASLEQSAAGKVAVITGGNRGMGFETCRQLARRGARVVLTSRNPGQGEAACPHCHRFVRARAGGLNGSPADGRQGIMDVTGAS